MASNLRVDTILPSSGTTLGIGTANGTINFLGNSNITTSGDVTIGGDLGVGGTITYEDVARVDATGLSTFREGYKVGPLTGIALTAYKDGSIRTSGIITAASFTGTVASSNLSGALPALDGSALTGVGVGTADSINTSGIITATAFVPSVGQLGHRNMVINGAMKVAQRGTVTGVLNTSYGGPDRWKAFRADAPGIWQLSRQESAPTGSGFSHCLEHKVTTANGTLDAGDEACITYSFEGQDLHQICKGTSSAKEVTLSFWCRTGTSGTYIAELYDTDNNRQVSKSFTHAGSDGWEKKEITFPADTTGTFTHDHNESLALRIWIAAGTTWTSGTLSTTWTSPTDANRAVGCTNLSATLNNYFRLTGVQLEIGSVATPFEHRRYDDELRGCQRYYWRTFANNNEFFPGMGMADIDGNTVILNTQFPVRMRSAPSALEQSGTASDYKIRRSTTQTCSSVPTFGHATLDQVSTQFTKSSHGWGDGSAVRCMGGTTDAYLGWSAEL
jgi:hypothetical protein